MISDQCLAMKDESTSKDKSTLDKMLENNADKRNALKKIIQELDKEENKKNQTKNKKS